MFYDEREQSVDASTALLTPSKASVITGTATVRTADKRVIVMAGDKATRLNNPLYIGRSFRKTSEMVPEMTEEQYNSDKEAAPVVRSTVIDKNGKVELSVTLIVVDEPDEDLISY